MKTNINQFTNEKFFGREKELSELCKRLGLEDSDLEQYNSFQFAAPRRVGKTFLATEILKKAQEKEYFGVFIDVEGCLDETYFIETFVSKLLETNFLPEKISKKLQGLRSVSITILGTGGAGEWEKKKTTIYKELENILKEFKGNAIIVIDELTIFLENLKEKASPFLFWLKSLRKKYKNIRWIYCSSMSIEAFIEENNLQKSTIDIESFDLGEFNKEEAILFIKKLAREKIEFNNECIDYLLKKIGWKLPHYIQILFSEICKLITENQQVSNTIIDQAYSNALNNKNIVSYFKIMKADLKQYKEYEKCVKKILEALSYNATGVSENTIKTMIYEVKSDENDIDKIFNRLKTGGYIMKNQNNKYTFRSPLLRDYWKDQIDKNKINKLWKK